MSKNEFNQPNAADMFLLIIFITKLTKQTNMLNLYKFFMLIHELRLIARQPQLALFEGPLLPENFGSFRRYQ